MRQRVHGNTKFMRLSSLCKGLVCFWESTDLEYNDVAVQVVLEIIAEECVSLIENKKIAAKLKLA